jgi:hypothetical protein
MPPSSSFPIHYSTIMTPFDTTSAPHNTDCWKLIMENQQYEVLKVYGKNERNLRNKIEQ